MMVQALASLYSKRMRLSDVAEKKLLLENRPRINQQEQWALPLGLASCLTIKTLRASAQANIQLTTRKMPQQRQMRSISLHCWTVGV